MTWPSPHAPRTLLDPALAKLFHLLLSAFESTFSLSLKTTSTSPPTAWSCAPSSRASSPSRPLHRRLITRTPPASRRVCCLSVSQNFMTDANVSKTAQLLALVTIYTTRLSPRTRLKPNRESFRRCSLDKNRTLMRRRVCRHLQSPSRFSHIIRSCFALSRVRQRSRLQSMASTRSLLTMTRRRSNRKTKLHSTDKAIRLPIPE